MQPIEQHIEAGHGRIITPQDAAAPHVTVITTDEPVRVEIGGEAHAGPSGRWFKLWFCLVESGAWAAFSPAAAKVLVVLAKHANGNPSLACWPGVSTIATDAGLSRSAVFGAISELVESGWVIRRTVGGGANATTYQLTEPRRRGQARRQPPLQSAPSVRPLPLPPTAPTSIPARPSLPRPLVRATPTDPTTPVPPVQPAGRVPVQYSGPPPVHQAGPHLDSDQKNSSSTGSAIGPSEPNAAAAAVLKAEGFSEADVERLAAHGPARVRDAVENCDLLQKSGRLRSGRRAFIARAIVDGYSLYEGVEKARIPAAAARLPEIVGRAATAEQLEELNAMFPSRSAIEAVFRRGVLRPADIDERTPEELLRKLLEMTA